jgi:conjugal transfer/entry exclusion protein
MENNFHYHNLAHMLGHRYFNVRSEQELDVQAVVAASVAAMDAVAAARAAAEAAASSSRGSWWWRRPWPGL